MKLICIGIGLEFFLAALALIILFFADIPLGSLFEFELSSTLFACVSGGLLAFVIMHGLYLKGYKNSQFGRDLTDFIKKIGHQPVYILVLVSIAAGVGEELLFRGALQTIFVDKFGFVFGILGASLLFGLAHFVSKSYFLYAAAFSLLIGVFYYYSNDLLAAILLHAIYDFIALYMAIYHYKLAES